MKIDKAAEAAYCDLLGDFLDTPQQPEETMPKIPWTPEAAERMLDYLQQLENSMQSGMPMESAKDYASKAGGVANRIAGILHMLWTRTLQNLSRWTPQKKPYSCTSISSPKSWRQWNRRKHGRNGWGGVSWKSCGN